MGAVITVGSRGSGPPVHVPVSWGGGLCPQVSIRYERLAAGGVAVRAEARADQSGRVYFAFSGTYPGGKVDPSPKK